MLVEGILAVLALGVVGLVAERTHELGFRAPLELGPVHGRDPDALARALAARAPESAPGVLARCVVPGTGAEARRVEAPEEVEGAPARAGGPRAAAVDPVELEVAVQEQHRRLARGLRALRVLAACASGLGFAGAIAAIASIHGEHGLLGLDPARLARAALADASRLLALGMGTSAFALSSLVALQARARVAARDLERVADVLGAASRRV